METQAKLRESNSSTQSITFAHLEGYGQQGNAFLNGWDFFTGLDPTNGQVTYVDQNTAVRLILLMFLVYI